MKVGQLGHQEGGHSIGAVGSACAHHGYCALGIESRVFPVEEVGKLQNK